MRRRIGRGSTDPERSPACIPGGRGERTGHSMGELVRRAVDTRTARVRHGYAAEVSSGLAPSRRGERRPATDASPLNATARRQRRSRARAPVSAPLLRCRPRAAAAQLRRRRPMAASARRSDVREASPATISARTDVSAGIAPDARRARGGGVGTATRLVGAVAEHDAVAVEDVVDELEEGPELVAEAAPRRLLVLGQARHPERGGDRRREEPAGLEPVQRSRRARRRSGRAAGRRSCRACLGELAGDGGSAVARREAERLREERVAGEHGGGLAEPRPDARPAAALGVVVERRQVVVDERERVDELDRRRPREAPARRTCRPPRPSPGRSPRECACRPRARSGAGSSS